MQSREPKKAVKQRSVQGIGKHRYESCQTSLRIVIGDKDKLLLNKQIRI
jgi:hypothetical protein